MKIHRTEDLLKFKRAIRWDYHDGRWTILIGGRSIYDGEGSVLVDRDGWYVSDGSYYLKPSTVYYQDCREAMRSSEHWMGLPRLDTNPIALEDLRKPSWFESKQDPFWHCMLEMASDHADQ